ncbi:hypothetical protein M426DRAFT_258551 [Hypoxylon sp. CI-4A]|nr:hypothetical protein M426DRAFT_258551 [Hypoxylon sp. CI-4A]
MSTTNGVKSIGSSSSILTPKASIADMSNSSQNESQVEIDSGADGKNDAICIIGMSCRLPGDVRSTNEMWDFLSKKKSGQCRVPAQRFNIDGFHHEDDNRAGVMSADGGYFLNEDVRQFDNHFFGINNLEAIYMDPHQRKLLEVVYECFENAGLPVNNLSGTNTGVYVSNFTVDFVNMHFQDPDYLNRYSSTGSNMAIIANRISHVFNLRGPSLCLNTACSSSLYCLHVAAQAILAGDCDDAIVAGANLIMSPEPHLETMKGGVLSSSSTCQTFDESADGYGRAEGVNAVYLKRLSSAMRDGDKIWGVIRGTAVNSNGKTPGIAQPSAELQEAVIRKAYSHAGLSFSDTDYIECHGTGTAVGDVIEVEALGRCFARSNSPLLIGSVKTNFGHSEAASGLTSLIKVLLAFDRNEIPPTFGVKNLNPKLNLGSLNMKVVTDAEEWPRSIRRASINSFGYGGSNAHAILESFDSYFGKDSEQDKSVASIQDQILVYPVSAKSSKSLESRLDQISTMVRNPTVSINSLAFTLGQRIAHFKHRSFLLSGDGTCSDQDSTQIIDSRSAEPLRIAFVFTGQGAQYSGMARELLFHSPVFLEAIRELDSSLQSLPPGIAPTWSLEQVIADLSFSKTNQALYSQPLCTAIQIGLVKVLKSWGISPSAVVGHSSGEMAAAYASGFLTASQSIIIAFLRGYAVSKAKATGLMLATGLEPQAAQQLILEKGLTKEVCVACVNDPNSITLSGSRIAIETMLFEIQGQQKFAQKLETGGQAYHSHLMKDVGAYYEELFVTCLGTDLSMQSCQSAIPMYSSKGEGIRILEADCDMTKYWRENLEQPVQFFSALKNLVQGGDYHLIEIGPHHALQSPIKRILAHLDKSHLPYSPTLAKNQNAELSIKKLAGSLFSYGHTLKWQEVNAFAQGTSLPHSIPPYPWDYQSKLLWYEPRASVELRNRKYLRHELLGSQQLAGNGLDWSWRNILRLGEVPWIRDHKLENQIIFPAAAYMVMAIEALSQVQDLRHELHNDTVLEFRDVSFSAALVIQDDVIEADSLELHTTISSRKLSLVTSSEDWYDFSISSWTSGQTTKHCAGSIRAVKTSILSDAVTVTNPDGFETWPSMNRWYDILREEGLNFGPSFKSVRSLSTDGTRTRSDAISTTLLQPQVKSVTDYFLHPIVIDACIQAAIFGDAKGSLGSLHAYLPVFISECQIRSSGTSDTEGTILTRSTKTGPSVRRIDATLHNLQKVPVLSMKQMRMSMYTGRTIQEARDSSDTTPPKRHPCLRVRWKPDIMRLDQGSAAQLKTYVEEFIANQHPDFADDAVVSIVGALLDLAGHKTPSMRVLELGSSCECKAKEWVRLLDKDTSFRRFRSWNTGDVDGNGNVKIESGPSGPFDVLLIPGNATSKRCWEGASQELLGRVSKEKGIVITRRTEEAVNVLHGAHFTLTDVGHNIILATRQTPTWSLKNREVIIVHRGQSSTAEEFADNLEEYLKQTVGVNSVRKVSLYGLHEALIDSNTVCISMLELESEFLASMNEHDMDLLRKMTNTVANLAWITGTQALEGSNPRLTMSNGLSRSLMLEHPSLRFSVIDIGSPQTFKTNIQATCGNVLKALIPGYDLDDKEFIQSRNLVFVSRYYPDANLNPLFQRRMAMSSDDKTLTTTLASAGPAQLAIGKVGALETIHFQQMREPFKEVPAGFVDIQVKAVSLNAKDIYNLHGRVEVRQATTACEFAGVVVAVGADVTHIQLGDRVVAMAPNYFTTTERVPAWTVQKFLPDEKFTVMSTIPVAYSTSLFALQDCARLRSGESVLIHAGSGALGIAAISIAQKIGAVIYTTASSQAKKQFLISHFGLPASHIFNSRDTSFVDGINTATGGRGVDVILNSLVGDLMHASWNCIASFGRFLEVGKRELVNAGRLDMAVFQRNATFTAFDLSEMFFSEDPFRTQTFASKLKEALELYRSGHAKLGPIEVFDVADISSAYRHFSSKDRMGKVVISLENPQSQIRIVEPRYQTIFDPEKIYLLVGCLGGLGRSISRWMATRGARHLVFLGRSGGDKPSAQKLILLLKSMGVESTVIKGDILSFDDVKSAINVCISTGRPIGGVIQAAMGLHDALFERMPNTAWHEGIDAKWVGTWNLHAALEGHDKMLDFFLMTSSVSGTVGIATGANYCASNGFLDAFARWRREQGKPATSIGLGMISDVGYLHENPEIGNIFLRKGTHSLSTPLTEEEFLQIVDFALATGSDLDPNEAHILTGMESLGFRDRMPKRSDVNNLPMLDPRSSILVEALDAEQFARDAGLDGKQGRFAANTAVWAKELPALASGSLLAETDAISLHDAVLRVVRKQFSNLVLIPLDQIEDKKPLAQFGVDSMIASEFRTWFWAAFKVDIPFLDLLSSTRSLSSLADTVEMSLMEDSRAQR